MTYQIKYFYETGNTFGRHNDEGVLDITWESKDAARKALKDIQEHYRYYQAVSREYRSSSHLETEDRKIIEESKSKEWFVKPKNKHDFSHHCLVLKTDNNKEYKFSAPWAGYFETLYGAEIISTEDSKDKFELSRW